MKSIREIAEEIAEGVTNSEHHNAKLARRIEQALRDRDERAAKIAEDAFEPAHTYVSENASDYMIYDNGQRRAMQNIAAAIRKED